jgi:hypothetical protein
MHHAKSAHLEVRNIGVVVAKAQNQAKSACQALRRQ